jgi:hypothetical protein
MHSVNEVLEEAFETNQLSPLWMVTQDPAINRLVNHLQVQALDFLGAPEEQHVLEISGSKIDQAREAFYAIIRRGESRLHRLCALLSRRFLKEFEINSVVIGEIQTGGRRFTLVQNLSPTELFKMTDLDLGSRQLSKFRVQENGDWHRPRLIANLVEYEPDELDDWGIHRITSRIMVDEIFELDNLVQRDKQLRHLSRYVKDIFGLKVVVTEASRTRRFHETLVGLQFTDAELEAFEIPRDETTARMEFVETKDYLNGVDPKRSGWRAIKSVVRWWGDPFEIQVQPLRNYLQERERLTRVSHASFKTRREDLRDEITRRLPLYGFYRELLRWLFQRQESAAPTFPNIELSIGP